ncbi:MAG: MBL fold metallo-hydrolase [Solirubrobacteraceae bacterium]
MKIHAIQTGTVAIKTRQVEGVGHGSRRRLNMFLDRDWTDPLPIYAFAIEHPEGVIVVDTGETARACEASYFPSWHPYFRYGVREWVAPEEEIGPRLQRLGIAPGDVRWVKAGDVTIVPMPGHTPGQIAVLVEDGDHVVLLAGDSSYTEELMLRGIVDGPSSDDATAPGDPDDARE